MNRYGAIAREHWARWLPARYAAIEDPDSFFSDLGSQAEARIDSLADRLAGDDQPGEGFLAKAGRLGEARHRAEQIVLTEDILLPPEPGADPDEDDRNGRNRARRGAWRCCTRSDPETGGLAGGFRPAGQQDLAPSGAVARARANLAALTVLRQIQREGRGATAAEQGVLARWSGWGAVPEVFDPGRADYAWAREQLAALLSPQEMAAAARNTLNAHYTDAAIVQAVWAAVQRPRVHRRPGAGAGLRQRQLHRLRPRQRPGDRGGAGPGDGGHRGRAAPGRADPAGIVRRHPGPGRQL